MFTTEIRLPGSEWLEGLRKETGRLLLRMPLAPRLGERIAIRVQLAGQPVCATVIGSVASVHRQGQQHYIELAPETESLPSVHFLEAVALGKRFRFSERQIRYLIRFPVLIAHRGTDRYATTLSISEGGCALKWSGPLPAVGQSVRLRFRSGRRPVELDGTVCWTQPSSSAGTAGVRFVTTMGSTAVASLLAEARETGAPQA